MAKPVGVTSPALVISPELVLVDPELAALCRESLQENAAADLAPASSSQFGSESVAAAMAPAPPMTSEAGGWRRNVRVGLFALSVAANLLLLIVVVGSRSGPLPRFVGAAPLRPPATRHEATTSPATETSHQIEGVVRKAQERVLEGLQRDATLRRRFVDKFTGLPRNGVLARCRPPANALNGSTTLLCVVEGQLGLRHVTSIVRYQALPNGRYSIAVDGPEHAG